MSIVKLLHLLFVFTWMGSLLFLSFFFGLSTQESDAIKERIALISKKIYLFVQLPSMVLALGLGWLLFFAKGVSFKGGWLHMKLTFAALLIGMDLLLALWLWRKERRWKSRGFYRVLQMGSVMGLMGVLSAVYILKPRYQEKMGEVSYWQKSERQATMSGLERKNNCDAVKSYKDE